MSGAMAADKNSRRGGLRFMTLKWLITIQLLLTEQVLCRVLDPPSPRKDLLQNSEAQTGLKETDKRNQQVSLGLRSRPSSLSSQSDVPVWQQQTFEEQLVQSAEQLISDLKENLKIQERLNLNGNISCGELLSASAVDDSLASTFPQELLGLSLVPVMVWAGCPEEAQTLVLKLYDLLGETDTKDLLMELKSELERQMRVSSSPTSPSKRNQEERHIEAVMFNIQQLVNAGEDTTVLEGRCGAWTRVNGTTLVGTAVDGPTGGREEAIKSCERLGVLCAGVTRSGGITADRYQAVQQKGSRILPSASSESECWIRQCSVNEVASGQRLRRSLQKNCINSEEKRVYQVVEWIPAVSTLYNLGTAVYYAALNCTETAKERALLSAVDLGTDAIMVATGGTAGVAGYALGAGVKTGVKAGVRYMLTSMREDDDIKVNQFSWDDGDIIMQ